MAWLLAQRAYQAGKIIREKISTDAYRLSEESACVDWKFATGCDLPPLLFSLLGCSYNLYRSMQRLDQKFIAH